MTAPPEGRRVEIVRAALELLDESGLEAVSLRAVAGRIGVRLNTVSWHVKTKQRLLELMADAIVAEIPLTDLPVGWDERVRTLIGRFRLALLHHRDGARVVAGTYAAEPATLAVAEALVGALLDAGLDERAAGWTCWTLIYLTLGLTQEEQAAPGGVAERLEVALDVQRHPALARTLPYLADGEFAERFAFGVDLVLARACSNKVR